MLGKSRLKFPVKVSLGTPDLSLTRTRSRENPLLFTAEGHHPVKVICFCLQYE